MTHEEIIVKLTEKVLLFEEGITEKDKSIEDWITRYKETVLERDIANKNLIEIQQYAGEQNRKVMELEKEVKRLEGELTETKREFVALQMEIATGEGFEG